jgi:hypothetical protein
MFWILASQMKWLSFLQTKHNKLNVRLFETLFISPFNSYYFLLELVCVCFYRWYWQNSVIRIAKTTRSPSKHNSSELSISFCQVFCLFDVFSQ